jgi:hypothetical protein
MVLNMKPFVLVGNPDMPRLTYSGCKSTFKESLDIFKTSRSWARLLSVLVLGETNVGNCRDHHVKNPLVNTKNKV